MNYPFAVWASQGYIVYIVEPSGAIGFGQEFASRHVNTWGTGSSDDILEGAKGFCRANPFADSTRVACIGASYGGFMTEYLLTRTDFFRTAVAHAGISDLTGYWGAGNWGYTYNEVAAAESYPWNNRELYVDHSPLYHADKITTPLLLVQGSVDTNVPANQAWQLYTSAITIVRNIGRKPSAPGSPNGSRMSRHGGRNFIGKFYCCEKEEGRPVNLQGGLLGLGIDYAIASGTTETFTFVMRRSSTPRISKAKCL